jgi:hypothetical protein
MAIPEEDRQSDRQSDRQAFEQKRFRFDTTIGIAHILTTVALVFAIFSWGADLKATVQKHEFEIADIKTGMRYDRDLMRQDFLELNRKIDRISDRVGANNQNYERRQ